MKPGKKEYGRGTSRLRRSGLTIVELLVATALASMLLVVAMETLKTLTLKRKTLIGKDSVAPWTRLLEEQLRCDLANARRFAVAPERIQLLGYGARDFDTKRPTHRRSEVIYRLTQVAGRTWLIREEIQSDVNTNRNRRQEIVCCGVTSITLEIPGQADTQPYMGAMPEQFRLILRSATTSEPVIDIYCCR